MPSPQFLAILPKPILFGLYGAIGGLLGALAFGEPVWQLLRPPPPAPIQPEPQLAIAASKDLQVIVDKENTFGIEVARDGFDGPVDVKVENSPEGIVASRITIPKGATSGKVTVRASSSASLNPTPLRVVATATANGKPISETASVALQVISSPAPQADVFFVLDVTGSMQPAIDGIRDGIGRFASEMRANKIDFRIGLLAFRDLTIDPVPMDLLSFGGSPFTTDVESFRNKVGKLISMGGGDEPESCLEAVDKACQQPFRKGATKVLLLITDAPPKVKQGQNIPQTFEEEVAEARRTAQVVKEKEIDALHIVVRSKHRRIFEPLREAGLIKGGGRFFDLETTVARGERGFTSLLEEFTSSVVEAAAAKNPVKPMVAAQAEKPVLGVKGVQSSQVFAEESRGQLVLAIGLWTGSITALVCLALLAGQQHYLRGSLPDGSGIAAGLFGGLLVGTVGGAAGQGLYLLAPDHAVLASLFRIFGWAILGGLAGTGLSLFIPNLKWQYGLAGGALGGAIGALGYMIANSIVGDLVGRLVGGLALGFCIGLMVALVEAAFRSAWLEVRFGARETIAVNLGPEPVKIGSDNRACTVWARGAAPIALRYFIRSGRVVCEDTPNRLEAIVRNGDARQVGNVTVTVRTGSKEKNAESTNAKPSAAPPVRQSVASAPAPAALKPLGLDPLDDDPLPLPLSQLPTPATRPASATPPLPPRPPVPNSAAKAASPPIAAPRPTAPPAAAPKPAAGPRDPDACPSCGRKNPGRPGSHYCMLCDQTY